MKKKRTAILLALSLTVTAVLTGCGGSSQSAGAASSEAAAEAQAEAQPEEQAEEAGAEAQAESGSEDAQAADAGGQQAADADGQQAAAADQAQIADADQGQAADADQSQAADADLNKEASTGGSTAATAADQPAAPGLTGAAAQVADKFHVELEEAGKVSGRNEYRCNYDSLLKVEDDHYIFCDYNGNPVDPRPLRNVDYLGWDLYSVSVEDEGNVNSTALVDAQGEIIIPFEAAIIEFPSETVEIETPRYVLVLTGTEVTTDKSEALFFVTDRMFAVMAGDEDTLYKGTIKVYDLKNRQYVSGLEYEHGSAYDFAQVGDNILVDLGEHATVYSPDGKLIYTEQGSAYYNYKYFCDRVDGQSIIMDADGKQLYVTESSINVVDYESEYFMMYNGDTHSYTVINSRGEPVLDGEWNTVYAENKDRFRVKNDSDENYSLVAQDNSVIVSSPDMFYADMYGYIYFGTDDNYTLITPGNRIYEGLEDDSSNLMFTKDDDASYLVLNTGEFASCADYDADDIGKGVIALQNSDGKYGLVDAFTGEELLGFDYDDADDLNGDYICLKQGDDILIYKVVIVPEK